MKHCAEIENGRHCPWEDSPDFDNDWCNDCPSFKTTEEGEVDG